jgi:DNA-binding NtrC family response regulator
LVPSIIIIIFNGLLWPYDSRLKILGYLPKYLEKSACCRFWVLKFGEIMDSKVEIKGRVLLVDDDDAIRASFKDLLERYGYQITVAADGNEAKAMANRLKFDVAILDILLPDTMGLKLIPDLKKNNPLLEVIVWTGYSPDYDFIGAVQAGASDWIAKPCDPLELYAKIERVLRERKTIGELARKNNELEKIKIELEQTLSGLKDMVRGELKFSFPERINKRGDFPEIIGNSTELEKVLELVRLVAETTSSVIITGESGTGKELIAHSIHNLSDRIKKPFIPVNCGALSETLLESELFGHEKGAFTGAVANKRGLIEESDGGTLFLDEIGETPLQFQVKLLRVLQEGEFKPVGSSKSKVADIRIIAATNNALEAMVHNRTFRKDLYYRLNQFQIALPSLKDRIDDLPLLSQYFLERLSMENSKPLVGFSSEVIEKMFRYAWPGNIRELENMISQSVILATPPMVELKDMPTLIEKIYKDPRKTRLSDKTYSQAKEEFERTYFKSILERAKGNISAASRSSKMDRKQLREKARKLGLVEMAAT